MKSVIPWIVVVVIGGAWFVSASMKSGSNTKSDTFKSARGSSQLIESFDREQSSVPPLLPITQSTTCSFNRINGVSFEFREKEGETGRVPRYSGDGGKIYYDSSVESQPNIASFVDLDTDNPKIAANQGQGNLIRIYEDGVTIQLIDSTPLNSGTVIAYTIFKKEGVAIWSKQYNLFGVPYGSMAMGYCR
jgi:hypothetical protein